MLDETRIGNRRTPQPVISKCREEISRPPDPRQLASSAPHCHTRHTLHPIGLAIGRVVCSGELFERSHREDAELIMLTSPSFTACKVYIEDERRERSLESIRRKESKTMAASRVRTSLSRWIFRQWPNCGRKVQEETPPPVSRRLSTRLTQ